MHALWNLLLVALVAALLLAVMAAAGGVGAVELGLWVGVVAVGVGLVVWREVRRGRRTDPI